MSPEERKVKVEFLEPRVRYACSAFCGLTIRCRLKLYEFFDTNNVTDVWDQSPEHSIIENFWICFVVCVFSH